MMVDDAVTVASRIFKILLQQKGANEKSEKTEFQSFTNYFNWKRQKKVIQEIFLH